jgi:hypothetical protein
MENSRLSTVMVCVCVCVLVFTTSGGCSKKEKEPTPTETTTAASAVVSTIPSTPLAGTVEGEPFVLKKVSLLTAKGFGEWRLTIEGSTPVAATAALRMPVRSALGVGKTLDVAATTLAPGTRPPSVNIQAGPKNMTTNNASYRVEITKWDVKPCPTDDAGTHEGGLASGRILVKVPPENVEVSGTFTDAVVSYGQTPDWKYQ